MWESLSAGWDDRPLLRELPGTEDRQGTETISRQNGEVCVTPQCPVKLVDVRSEHYKAGRSALSGEDLDWTRIEEAATKIVEAVERNGGEITRRRLQQRFWRFRASIFNQALGYLARRGRITLDCNS